MAVAATDKMTMSLVNGMERCDGGDRCARREGNLSMARGNQRELSREKNAKKQGGTKESDTEKNKGLTPEQRNERDKAAMLEKQARKQAEKEAAAARGETVVEVQKKPKADKASKNQALNALLNAGLKEGLKPASKNQALNALLNAGLKEGLKPGSSANKNKKPPI